jgi:hypothetical protein
MHLPRKYVEIHRANRPRPEKALTDLNHADRWRAAGAQLVWFMDKD